MALNTAQTDFLTQPIHESRIEKDGKGMRHVAAWDVRRHLIRIFGWGGFDIATKRLELIRETETKPGSWTVVYLAEVRLTIKDPSGNVLATFEDGSTGDAQNQRSLGDAHDLAMKSSLSVALKRCAMNLGDQFGLSLYAKGIQGAVVGRTLAVTPEPDREKEAERRGDVISSLSYLITRAKSRDELEELQLIVTGVEASEEECNDHTATRKTLAEMIHARGAMLKLGQQKPGFIIEDIDEEDELIGAGA